MKNVTFSADEHLIEQARLVARSKHKTLNAAFREWLEEFIAQVGRRWGIRLLNEADAAR